MSAVPDPKSVTRESRFPERVDFQAYALPDPKSVAQENRHPECRSPMRAGPGPHLKTAMR